MYMKLFINAFAVCIHSVKSDVARISNHFVTHALYEHGEDFKLTWGEVESIGALLLMKHFKHFSCYRSRHGCATFNNLTNTFNKFGRRCLFHEITMSACADRLKYFFIILKNCLHDDKDTGSMLSY